MVDKNWTGDRVDPAWIETEVAHLNRAVDEFVAVMKERLAQKVR